MICKKIFLIKAEFIFYTEKWLQILLSNTDILYLLTVELFQAG